MKKMFAVLAVAAALAGCESMTTQRYAIAADNNLALKALGATGIGVSTFTGPASFDTWCRGLGPLRISDGLTHTQFIQRAFEEELKLAGAYAATSSRVAISGRVNKLDFSTVRGINGGTWEIDLTLTSTNGASLVVIENYPFDSGMLANEACRNAAEAYSRAVQNLVGRAVRSAEFSAMLK